MSINKSLIETTKPGEISAYRAVAITRDGKTIIPRGHDRFQLGDLVYVELPDVGTAVTAGGDMATVESFKAASSVYAPLSGKIIEINDSLSDDPAQVNSEPLGAGWFVKIKLDNPSAADALMDEDAYKALIA